MESIAYVIGYIFTIAAVVFLIILPAYRQYKEKQDDKHKDYSSEEIDGIFALIDGEKVFCVKYEKHQPNKKKFIKEIYFQGVGVQTAEDDRLYPYQITNMHDDEYYFRFKKAKDGPYIVYKITSMAGMDSSGIAIDGSDEPVSIVVGNDLEYQNVNSNCFIGKLQQYKGIMIVNGVAENDINKVLDNPENEEIKNFFLDAYGLKLLGIGVNSSGSGISLLGYLKNN